MMSGWARRCRQTWQVTCLFGSDDYLTADRKLKFCFIMLPPLPRKLSVIQNSNTEFWIPSTLSLIIRSFTPSA